EPSTMLIAALQVQVGGPGKTGLTTQHRLIARTGIEPHVKEVHLPPKTRSSALRALSSGGKNRLRRMFVPGVGAFASKHLDHRAIRRRVIEKFLAGFALKHRDRYAPDALARNTPVGARG